MDIEQRYNIFVGDEPEERIKDLRQLNRDLETVQDNIDRGVRFWAERNIQASDLVCLVDTPYVWEVLLDRAKYIQVRTGTLITAYNPDTLWAYAGEGYWAGKTQITNIHILLLTEYNKTYRWQND